MGQKNRKKVIRNLVPYIAVISICVGGSWPLFAMIFLERSFPEISAILNKPMTNTEKFLSFILILPYVLVFYFSYMWVQKVVLFISIRVYFKKRYSLGEFIDAFLKYDGDKVSDFVRQSESLRYNDSIPFLVIFQPESRLGSFCENIVVKFSQGALAPNSGQR